MEYRVFYEDIQHNLYLESELWESYQFARGINSPQIVLL